MHLFYISELAGSKASLGGDENHHCIHVLRHKPGDIVQLSDGNGKLASGTILNTSKNVTEIELIDIKQIPARDFRIHIAVSPTKQMERMEWMVEKLCEMAVDEITFLNTTHSERPTINLDRLEKKAISALKQSRSGWKTHINEMVSLKNFINNTTKAIKLVASTYEVSLHFAHLLVEKQHVLMLIGPEGDFTEKELNLLSQNNFTKVNMGIPILRTETAAIAAAWSVNFINKY